MSAKQRVTLANVRSQSANMSSTIPHAKSTPPRAQQAGIGRHRSQVGRNDRIGAGVGQGFACRPSFPDGVPTSFHRETERHPIEPWRVCCRPWMRHVHAGGQLCRRPNKGVGTFGPKSKGRPPTNSAGYGLTELAGAIQCVEAGMCGPGRVRLPLAHPLAPSGRFRLQTFARDPLIRLWARLPDLPRLLRILSRAGPNMYPMDAPPENTLLARPNVARSWVCPSQCMPDLRHRGRRGRSTTARRPRRWW